MPPATRSLYFENTIGRLWEEPEGYLRLEYKPGPRELVQFRALLTHAAQALSRHGWANMLVDQRQMAPFTPVEQAWMTGEWLPKAVHEHGYRHGAVLVAHNVFARLAMTQLVFGTRDLPHTYRTFENEAEAVAWLGSVKS
ncbi:STAS/SEC14 domain-containing protein [Hymenobacter sp. DH14]|uniref:STAS/SEC14 domain-containing protein n=1 Tax=Hymenobacter cyanobacteriorum TaxID=2926463 RepID=A0A9X2AFI9_9BACT|nr:STAS/SEC14 domain-containing protein [Hymenobacter cyanobacteriorum]MCI1187912.1 STAS/SEC14 domain-containing protein [Hymenobacter cyanobacteriorum]